PVTMDSSTTPQRVNEALVVIKQGNYGKTYKIFLNNFQAAVHQPPLGNYPDHAPQIDTSFIAEQLADQLTNGACSVTFNESNQIIKDCTNRDTAASTVFQTTR